MLEHDDEDHERLERSGSTRARSSRRSAQRRASRPSRHLHAARRLRPFVERVWPSPSARRRPRRGRRVPGAAPAVVHGAAHRAHAACRSTTTSTASPSRDPEALGVGGRELDPLLRAQEAAAPARPRPPWPAQSERKRAEAQRAVRRRRAAGGRSSSNGPASAVGQRRGRLALLPAHAAAADLVERQAGVERAPPRTSCAWPSAPVEARRAGEPSARGQLGQHAPPGAHLARGGRSPGAGAGGARRGA